MNNLSYIGVDVRKAHLNVASDLAAQRNPNPPTAIAAWLKKLPPQGHLIVEATGGYERPLVRACHRAGRPISVLNPARVRSFARARGCLAKTDAIDAAVLREFGRALQPKASPEAAPAQRKLAELVSARDHLVVVRTQLVNGLEHAELPLVRQCFSTQLRSLERRILKLEKALADAIQSSAVLSRRHDLLRDQPGIGLLSPATLLALLPELGAFVAHGRDGEAASLDLAVAAVDDARVLFLQLADQGRDVDVPVVGDAGQGDRRVAFLGEEIEAVLRAPGPGDRRVFQVPRVTGVLALGHDVLDLALQRVEMRNARRGRRHARLLVLLEFEEIEVVTAVLDCLRLRAGLLRHRKHRRTGGQRQRLLRARH